MSRDDEPAATCRFYSMWDNARAEEVMPWAECPDCKDPARLLRRETCCGQPPIGRCRAGDGFMRDTRSIGSLPGAS
jgi:hypothetical protein